MLTYPIIKLWVIEFNISVFPLLNVWIMHQFYTFGRRLGFEKSIPFFWLSFWFPYPSRSFCHQRLWFSLDDIWVVVTRGIATYINKFPIKIRVQRYLRVSFLQLEKMIFELCKVDIYPKFMHLVLNGVDQRCKSNCPFHLNPRKLKDLLKFWRWAGPS